MCEENAVGIQPISAEKLRKYLISNNLFNSKYKAKKMDKLVFFPLTGDNDEVESLLKAFDSEIVLKKISFEPNKKRLSLAEILSLKIPVNLTDYIPGSYDLIGDIIVVDLNQNIEDFEEEIGKALMEVNPSVKSVFRKTGGVGGEYRIREIKNIAGTDESFTIHKEMGIKIAVDIRKAYFSPRLSTEHQRVLSQVKENETIIDMFAGVGPFSLIIAKNLIGSIYCNDLNPYAIDYLNKSIQLNKLKGNIIPCNFSAEKLPEKITELTPAKIDRIIMNLPGTAKSYLTSAAQLSSKGTIIHFYCFSGGEDPEKGALDILYSSWPENRKIKILEVKKVRVSAPREYAMVIDFVCE
ncbi:MAG: class I SAM-dependent methyltransferase [Candidatus Kariarchaeaceae archaeon]